MYITSANYGRWRIIHLYAVLFKNNYFCINNLLVQKNKNLCTVKKYIRCYGCTVCFDESACFPPDH